MWDETVEGQLKRVVCWFRPQCEVWMDKEMERQFLRQGELVRND